LYQAFHQVVIPERYVIFSCILLYRYNIAGILAGLAMGAILIALGIAVVSSCTAMAGAFLCALPTGAVFGYKPATTASRVDPVVALAGE